MKRLLVALFILGLSSRVWADCSTTMPNTGVAPCTVGTARSVSDPAWINNFKLLDIGFTSPLSISGAGSASPTVSLGTVGETKGGTGQTTFTLGDTLYASGTNTLSKLNGNTSTTRKFRQQHGNGSAVNSNTWDTIQAADIASGTIDPARIVGSTPSDGFICASSGALVYQTTPCAAISYTLTSTQSLDTSAAASTIPNKVDSSAPGTCTVGMTYVDTSGTPTLYLCTATDTWTAVGGGGGGSSMGMAFPCQIHAGSTEYCGPAVEGTNTTAQAALVPMTASGTITKMYCGPDSAPGSGKTLTFTIQQNGSPTSNTCSISGNASFQCHDTTHSVSYAAGDNIYVEIVSTSGSTPTTATCTLS